MAADKQRLFFGHPKGLYPLFFTEMWERLAFYLMLGILVLYATDTERGGLGMSVKLAAEIYGTYLAFVYFTPFLGGMIADRYLGRRRSVFIGGILMAAGLFCLGVRNLTTFYAGLTLLCLGNGLFKPNISAMVGHLYAPGDPKRDTGFNIFYMGINIGASLSAAMSAPLRNEWNFNTAFIGAGVGLLIGVTILSFNWRKLEKADRPPETDPQDLSMGKVALTILLPAVVFGAVGYYVGDRVEAIRDTLGKVTFAFIVGMIPVMLYFLSLVFRAGPAERPGLAALIPVYVAGGAFFMILHLSGGLMTFFTEHDASRGSDWVPAFVQKYYCQKAMPSYYRNADPSVPRPNEASLLVVDPTVEAMFGARRISDAALADLQNGQKGVRAVDVSDQTYRSRWGFLALEVYTADHVSIREAADGHGRTTITVMVRPESAKPIREVILVREQNGATFPVLLVSERTYANVYAKASSARLRTDQFPSLINAELITGLLNPVFVVLLTPLVVAFFMWRVRLGKVISTARKIFYGMVITVISLLIMAVGAYAGGDGASKVSLMWLIAYYLVITVGELCLSPMGLSLVTKLSPRRLVGLMMGGWFLATSVGNKLAGFISGLDPSTGMFVILAGAPLAVALMFLFFLPTLDRALKRYGA